MRRSFLAIFLLGAAACIDIPDGVHAQFAAPSPEDRSNYRPGHHGSAPPVETPAIAWSDAGNAPTAKAADAKPDELKSDGGGVLDPSAVLAVDGGAP